MWLDFLVSLVGVEQHKVLVIHKLLVLQTNLFFFFLNMLDINLVRRRVHSHDFVCTFDHNVECSRVGRLSEPEAGVDLLDVFGWLRRVSWCEHTGHHEFPELLVHNLQSVREVDLYFDRLAWWYVADKYLHDVWTLFVLLSVRDCVSFGQVLLVLDFRLLLVFDESVHSASVVLGDELFYAVFVQDWEVEFCLEVLC